MIRSMDNATLRWMYRQVTAAPFMYAPETLDAYEAEMKRRGLK